MTRAGTHLATLIDIKLGALPGWRPVLLGGIQYYWALGAMVLRDLLRLSLATGVPLDHESTVFNPRLCNMCHILSFV